MAIYQGVVKDNRIELDGGVRLADGARVEVRTGADTAAAAAAAEEALIRRLRAEGIIDEPPDDAGADGDDEVFEPVAVRGEPLSEQIIRERR